MFSDLTVTNVLVLAIGLLLGVSIIFLIRARQIWRYRYGLGYSAYDADRVRRRLLRWAALGLVIMLGVGGVYLWRSGQASGQTLPQPIMVQAEEEPLPPMRLVVPRLGIEAPVIEAPIIARRWDISLLTDEVAHLAGTAYPGEPGNAVLAGHVTIPDAGWGPFKDLGTLEPGDRVFVERGDVLLIYEVFGQETVPADAVEVAFPTEGYRLTLITCTGWDDETVTYTQRVVVYAGLTPDP